MGHGKAGEGLGREVSRYTTEPEGPEWFSALRNSFLMADTKMCPRYVAWGKKARL